MTAIPTRTFVTVLFWNDIKGVSCKGGKN